MATTEYDVGFPERRTLSEVASAFYTSLAKTVVETQGDEKWHQGIRRTRGKDGGAGL